MERIALQNALYEIVEVRQHLQDVYDYLPRRDIVSLICECYEVEQQLRFLLDYNRVVDRDLVWDVRKAEMDQASSLQEIKEIAAKYRGPLCYRKRYL